MAPVWGDEVSAAVRIRGKSTARSRRRLGGGPAGTRRRTCGYEDLNDHDKLRDDALLALAVGKTDQTGN